jgi:hypothetical protein
MENSLNTILVVTVFKLTQLTIVSFLGFACIYLGCRLFAEIPISQTNDGHFKMPTFGEIKLRAAPGIFFALFGAAIMYFSVEKAIEITTPFGSLSTYQPPPLKPSG